MIPKIQSKATYSISKHQAKRTSHRISSKLKSQILAEILSPNSSIPHIAKQYNISSTTLYGWRSKHHKKNLLNTDNHTTNNQEIPRNNNNSNNSNNNNTSNSNDNSNNNFIELLTEELSTKSPSGVNSNKIVDRLDRLDESTKSLSEISLTFNHNISLSIKGNINSSALIKILSALENDDISSSNNGNNHHQDQSC